MFLLLHGLILIVLLIQLFHGASLVLFLHMLPFNGRRTIEFVLEFHVFLVLDLALSVYPLFQLLLVLLILIFFISRFLVQSRVNLVFRHSHRRRLRQKRPEIRVFHFLELPQLEIAGDGVVVSLVVLLELFMFELLFWVERARVMPLELLEMLSMSELLLG